MYLISFQNSSRPLQRREDQRNDLRPAPSPCPPLIAHLDRRPRPKRLRIGGGVGGQGKEGSQSIEGAKARGREGESPSFFVPAAFSSSVRPVAFDDANDADVRSAKHGLVNLLLAEAAKRGRSEEEEGERREEREGHKEQRG